MSDDELWCENCQTRLDMADHDRQVSEKAWDEGKRDNTPRANRPGTNPTIIWPNPTNPYRKAENDAE